MAHCSCGNNVTVNAKNAIAKMKHFIDIYAGTFIEKFYPDDSSLKK